MPLRIKKRIIAAALAVILLCGMSGSLLVEASQKSDLQQQLSQLQNKEKRLKNELSKTSSDLSKSQQRKKLLDQQIDTVSQQLDILDGQIETLDADITATETDIQSLKNEIEIQAGNIETTKIQLGQRLRVLAKTGNTTTLQVLMNAQSYEEYLLKSEWIKRIAAKDQQIIDSYASSIEEMKVKQSSLQNKQAELNTQKTALSNKKQTSEAQKGELDSLYVQAANEEKNLKSSVADYNKQIEKTQKEIEAANKQLEQLLNNNKTSGTYNGKMMFWPVPTVRALSSTYGSRWGTVHRGIDIANGKIPIYGQNIVAAADGTVILANYTSRYGSGWSHGYGYSCVIEHGKDAQGRTVTTLYAHCSVMNARVGQKVIGGQTVIGKAGNTGNVTGPHLHFEVRLNGRSTDPLGTYVSPNVN